MHIIACIVASRYTLQHLQHIRFKNLRSKIPTNTCYIATRPAGVPPLEEKRHFEGLRKCRCWKKNDFLTSTANSPCLGRCNVLYIGRKRSRQSRLPTSCLWGHWNANVSPNSNRTRGLLSAQRIASSCISCFSWYVIFFSKTYFAIKSIVNKKIQF